MTKNLVIMILGLLILSALFYGCAIFIDGTYRDVRLNYDDNDLFDMNVSSSPVKF